MRVTLGIFPTSSVLSRLSALYFVYFAIVGAYMPYWSLFLHDRGLDGVQIGVVLAVTALGRMLVPHLWGWLSDRSGQPTRILQGGALVSTALFSGLLLDLSFHALLWLVAAYSVFWNAILPQLEVVTLASLAGETRAYSRARVWGSVSFILAVVGIGRLFDVIDVSWLPAIVLALMAVFCVVSTSAPAIRRPGTRAAIRRLMQVLADPQVRVFLAASFLGQIALASFYSFFSLRLEGLGISRSVTGMLWAVGVVAEIGLFMVMHRLLVAVGIRGLLLVAFATGVVRWCILGFSADVMPLLVIAQLGHATTFGILHSVSIEFIHRHFPAEVAGQGPALYSAVCYGAGGAFGNLASGWLWDHAGPGSPFVMAAVASCVAGVLVWCLFRDPVQEE